MEFIICLVLSEKKEEAIRQTAVEIERKEIKAAGIMSRLGQEDHFSMLI